jgi:cephalosporin-C deacetylase
VSDPQYKTHETAMRTLGYIDCVHFCEKIHCPALMQIGLEDDVTPPSTVFAAFHNLSSNDKKIEVYPQFSHETNPFHEEKKLAFIMKYLIDSE